MYANLEQVPFYGLYGEPLKTHQPDLIHIEEIADRSRDCGWIINNHRHSKLFQVIYLQEGAVEVFLDGINQLLFGSWVISIPMGIVHGFKFQPNSMGFVLSIDHSILMNSLKTHHDIAFNNLIYSPQLIKCLQEDTYSHQFLQYMLLLQEEFNHYQVKRHDALEWLSRLTLLSLMRHIHQDSTQDFSNADSHLLGKFWSCLELNYRDHQPVSHYAEHLHVSASTLNRLCHKYVGESPKTILQERLLLEAQKRLVYTQQSVEEIAFYLGFKDQAYFSRFFKSHLGLTPGAYRKNSE